MSRRVGFLLPIATGRARAVLRAIDGLSYDEPFLRYQRQDGTVWQYHVMPVDDGVTMGGVSWDIWWITPESFCEYRAGTTAYRFFARNADNVNVAKPYTIAEAFERFPAWSANHLLPQRATAWDVEGNATAWEPIPGSVPTAPHVYAGDTPEVTAVVDYRPTDNEISNDIETAVDELFPLQVEEEGGTKCLISNTPE